MLNIMNAENARKPESAENARAPSDAILFPPIFKILNFLLSENSDKGVTSAILFQSSFHSAYVR